MGKAKHAEKRFETGLALAHEVRKRFKVEFLFSIFVLKSYTFESTVSTKVFVYRWKVINNSSLVANCLIYRKRILKDMDELWAYKKEFLKLHFIFIIRLKQMALTLRGNRCWYLRSWGQYKVILYNIAQNFCSIRVLFTLYLVQLDNNELYLRSSENEAWKKFRPVRDLNPWPPRYRCSALPTELTSQLGTLLKQ